MTLRPRTALAAVFLTTNAAMATCPDTNAGRVDVYPTSDVLPANLLRMYVYYPRAMKADEGLQHVRLKDQTGKVVDEVFLGNRADLWSPDRRRLTLLLDPGRVKTGLVANAVLGRTLVPGQSYTLVVSGDATDMSGCILGADTRYDFVVGAEDMEPPDPASWYVALPTANSMDTLSVDLGSSHDHLSLAYRLRVVDHEGAAVPGAIALGRDEAVWAFRPDVPWAGVPYRLTIDERLEDLAGNRPGVLFDRPPDQDARPWAHSIQIIPKPPPRK
ncbi:MAG: hypothetical protein ACFB11_09360 [Paracoccaceae bacterium]